jgi:diaminopimelate decarboxylase
MLNVIKDDKDKLLLTSNVFCLLQHVESQVYKNEACIKAIEAAASKISRLEDKQGRDISVPPQVPKEQAKKWVNCALPSAIY